MSAFIQKAIDGEAMRISGISEEEVVGYKYLDDDEVEKTLGSYPQRYQKQHKRYQKQHKRYQKQHNSRDRFL